MKRMLTVLTTVTLWACGGPGEAGDPCEVADDCGEGLECDIPEGEEAGTCAEPAAEE